MLTGGRSFFISFFDLLLMTTLLQEEEEMVDVKPDYIAMLQAETLLAPGVDKQAWKKQQRMIRNRESAALSRKRKRDRIESLEEQVSRDRKLRTDRPKNDQMTKYVSPGDVCWRDYWRCLARTRAGRALTENVFEHRSGALSELICFYNISFYRRVCALSLLAIPLCPVLAVTYDDVLGPKLQSLSC